MSTRVTWMDRALEKVREDLVAGFTREIERTFPNARAVTVYGCYHGYTCDQENKIVLGVEVRSKDSCRSHILKLGASRIVSNDYEGWRKCVLKRNFASRIFVSVTHKKLPNRRAAVIYQDAYTLYGPDEAAEPLEKVARWAILDDKPDPESVERVIRQTFSELGRWFYAGSRPDADLARRYYDRRLLRALPKWASNPQHIELRRDLLWLLCTRTGCCLDPYDYICWVLERGTLPQTLVGRSHGDLHARNILVGVQHGEAQYPAVFDYGDMDDQNVLVWDFVKLETELKVRLLQPLYQNDEARLALVAQFRELRAQNGWPSDQRPSPKAGQRAIRADRMAFAAAFESLLADRTSWIGGVDEASASSPSWSQDITVNPQIDRALGILLQIRQQAACQLGENQPQRGSRRLWKDEFYFGLAVYGLCTAKFDYTPYQTEFALVSSAVATAQLEMAQGDIRSALAAKPVPPSQRSPRVQHPYPSYQVPLAHAHALWTARRTKANVEHAVELLSDAVRHFPHAVPLLQEYALALAEAGRDSEAADLLKGFKGLSLVFRDEETLCRIARTHKDFGDRELEKHPVPISDLKNSPAFQSYRAAYTIYKDAFDIRQHYYPGVNVATLAYLLGLKTEARKQAKLVLARCTALDLNEEDAFWVFVSEGEASLLLGERRKAVSFYDRALSLLRPDRAGMAQSAYNQVCRLYWALGEAIVGPVVRVFRGCPFRLRSGPLGNCVSRTRPRRSTATSRAKASRRTWRR